MVRAFAYTSVGGYPTSFLGYAEANVTVNANDTISELELPLKKMATRKIEGSFTGPTYAAWLYPELDLLPANQGRRFDRLGGASRDPVRPRGARHPGRDPPARVWRRPGRRDGDGEGVVADCPLLTGAATPIAPAPGASFTPGMTFSWKPPADTRGTYRFRLESGATDPALQIWTKASSATVPGPSPRPPARPTRGASPISASLATVDGGGRRAGGLTFRPEGTEARHPRFTSLLRARAR